MDAHSSGRLFTRQFWILSLSTFLFFGSFNMIIPELPDYLTSLGGADYKGFYIAMFTLGAAISRPVSGKLADTIGRVPIILFGTFVTAACGLFYPILDTVLLFLTLRFFHGFSTGFAPTGAMAYIGDVAPAHRRGEAIGLVSMFGTLGMAMGPALGGYIGQIAPINVLFLLSSAFGMIALAMSWPLRETLPNKQKFKFSQLWITRADFFEPRVLRPAVVLMLVCFSFGAMLTLIPDLSKYLGLKNKGLFFPVFTISSLFSRVIAGKLSDRIGRIITLRVGISILVLGMVLLALSTNLVMFFAAAVLFGIATGVNSPTAIAWTIDLSEDNYRGRAISTAYIFLEIGIGGGSLLGAWLYDNNPDNFDIAFYACSALCVLALVLMFLPMKYKSAPVQAAEQKN